MSEDGITLIADNVKVRFGAPWRRHVLRNVSLQAYKGEIVCVIGPNGAGKTTLLNLLAGSLFKTRNRITILGMDRWKQNLAIRQKSTFVPALPGFEVGETPLDHLLTIARVYRIDPGYYKERCAELVSDMNFSSHIQVPWASLSLGLRHKAMLIGGFLPPAQLRILDEPVASGIDPLGMEILGTWMREGRDRGETIIFSTQVLDRAHLLADKLVILGRGESVFQGTPAKLIQQAGLNPDDDFALNKAFFKLFRGSDS